MSMAFFDLDGTLADTRADMVGAVNDTRREFGLPPLSQSEVLAHVGGGAQQLLSGTVPGHEDALPLFRAHYAEHATDQVALYPGVAETLAELRRRGWRLGVNTNKPRFATVRILRHLEIDEFFGEAVVAGGDLSVLKPDPATLVECAQRAGHRLTNADWMVGDHWTDLEVAAGAGIQSAFAEFGFGERRARPATATIRRFDELLRHLR